MIGWWDESSELSLLKGKPEIKQYWVFFVFLRGEIKLKLKGMQNGGRKKNISKDKGVNKENNCKE